MYVQLNLHFIRLWQLMRPALDDFMQHLQFYLHFLSFVRICRVLNTFTSKIGWSGCSQAHNSLRHSFEIFGIIYNLSKYVHL